jgi:hypothetical protein
MALLKPSPAILHENPWCQQAADSYRAFIIGTEVGTNFPSSLFFPLRIFFFYAHNAELGDAVPTDQLPITP